MLERAAPDDLVEEGADELDAAAVVDLQIAHLLQPAGVNRSHVLIALTNLYTYNATIWHALVHVLRHTSLT